MCFREARRRAPSNGATRPSDDSGLLTVLTVTPIEPTETTDDTGVILVATDHPKLEQAFRLIREAFSEVAERSAEEAIARVMRAAGASGITMPRNYSGNGTERKRAPAGSAPLLCERTLSEAGDNGLTASRIVELASTEYEKMLSISAIRNELSAGEKAGKYRHVGGVWYLKGKGPTKKTFI